jgi:hypothetical protein
VVYQISNNNYLGRDQLKEYKLVISCYLLFVRTKLIEVIILEALVLGYNRNKKPYFYYI